MVKEVIKYEDVIDETIITTIAKKIQSKWGNKVDYNDIKQEIYLHILKHPVKFAEYLTNSDTGKYYKAAYNAGTKYVAKDVKSYDQIHYNNTNSYNRDIVLGRLKEALEGKASSYSPSEEYNFTDDDFISTTNSTYIDIRYAFKQLPLRSRRVIFSKYVLGYSALEIQKEFNISSQANVYKILWDGINNIVRILNSADMRLNK